MLTGSSSRSKSSENTSQMYYKESQQAFILLHSVRLDLPIQPIEYSALTTQTITHERIYLLLVLYDRSVIE